MDEDAAPAATYAGASAAAASSAFAAAMAASATGGSAAAAAAAGGGGGGGGGGAAAPGESWSESDEAATAATFASLLRQLPEDMKAALLGEALQLCGPACLAGLDDARDAILYNAARQNPALLRSIVRWLDVGDGSDEEEEEEDGGGGGGGGGSGGGGGGGADGGEYDDDDAGDGAAGAQPWLSS